MRCFVALLRCGFLCTALLATASHSQAQSQPKPPAQRSELTASSIVGGKTLDQWVADLKDRDLSVRGNALATLRLYGPAARGKVRDVILLTTQKDVSLRVNAVIALGAIGLDVQDIPVGVTALTNLLSDSQLIIRYQAAMTLASLGPDARSAIPRLLVLAKDPGAWELRKAAVSALGSVAEDTQSGPDPRALQGIIEALSDYAYMVRLEAVLAIIILGPPAQLKDKQAVERALGILMQNERNKIVQIWTRVAVMRMEKPSELHLGAIARYLKNPEAQARSHAARALGTLGRESKGQVTELANAAASEQDDITLYWMLWALGRMEEAAKAAVPTLMQLQQHKEPAIRQAATDALDNIQGKLKK